MPSVDGSAGESLTEVAGDPSFRFLQARAGPGTQETLALQILTESEGQALSDFSGVVFSSVTLRAVSGHTRRRRLVPCLIYGVRNEFLAYNAFNSIFA